VAAILPNAYLSDQRVPVPQGKDPHHAILRYSKSSSFTDSLGQYCLTPSWSWTNNLKVRAESWRQTEGRTPRERRPVGPDVKIQMFKETRKDGIRVSI